MNYPTCKAIVEHLESLPGVRVEQQVAFLSRFFYTATIETLDGSVTAWIGIWTNLKIESMARGSEMNDHGVIIDGVTFVWKHANGTEDRIPNWFMTQKYGRGGLASRCISIVDRLSNGEPFQRIVNELEAECLHIELQELDVKRENVKGKIATLDGIISSESRATN